VPENPPPPIPAKPSVASLRRAIPDCRACDLYKRGTQAVFGAGRARARVMLVGEQPGNDEDLTGLPFVGPAGRELDRGLEAAGVDRKEVWVTNVVKHFKWEPRGKRRIHKKPNAAEINACFPWLEAELRVIRPEVLVCLGATAAQTIMGRSFRVTRQRGEILTSPFGIDVLATIHPSAILRARTDGDRRREREGFIEDLRVVARAIAR
jgi:uracil-DNA glycosylase